MEMLMHWATWGQVGVVSWHRCGWVQSPNGNQAEGWFIPLQESWASSDPSCSVLSHPPFISRVLLLLRMCVCTNACLHRLWNAAVFWFHSPACVFTARSVLEWPKHSASVLPPPPMLLIITFTLSYLCVWVRESMCIFMLASSARFCCRLVLWDL